MLRIPSLSAFSQSLLSYSFERRRRRLVAVASAIAQRAHQSTSSQSSSAQSTGRYFVPLGSLSRRKGSSWSFWTALYPLWRSSSKISIRLLFRFNFWTLSMPEIIAKRNSLLVRISTAISRESYSSKPGNCCFYLLCKWHQKNNSSRDEIHEKNSRIHLGQITKQMHKLQRI